MDRFYDRYDFRARLSVAILIVSPIVLDLSFCINYQEGSISAIALTLIAIALSCCGIAAVQYCNNLSKIDKNKKNTAETMLLLNDGSIPKTTKRRYYKKLKTVNPDLKPLVEKIEAGEEAEEESKSIVSWILENTRDSALFPVLADKKVGYGFAKNMCTVKKFALAVFFFESCVALCLLYLNSSGSGFLDTIQKAWELYKLEIITSVSIHIMMLFVWVIVARKRFYDDAQKSVALAILSSIDGIVINKCIEDESSNCSHVSG